MTILLRYLVLVYIFSIGGMSGAMAASLAKHPVPAPARFCALSGHGDLTAQEALTRRGSFVCGANALAKDADHFWIIADIGNATAAMEDPRLVFRTGIHGNLTVYTVTADGEIASVHYTPHDLRDYWFASAHIAAPLPELASSAQTLLISIETPWGTTNWNGLHLLSKTDVANRHDNTFFASMIFGGILFAPLIMNLIFFGLLRYKVLLWQSIMTTSLVVYSFPWTGMFFDLFPGATVRHSIEIENIFICMALMSLTLVVRDLCEDGTLNTHFKWLIGRVALLPLALTILLQAIVPMFPFSGYVVLHLAYLVPVIISSAALIMALSRGSIMARFQIVAWSGVLVVGGIDILRGLGLIGHDAAPNIGFLPALVLEVFVTSAAIGYRIIGLRRTLEATEKDRQALTEIAEIDPLTGLLNRRAFLHRFNRQLSLPLKSNRQLGLVILDVDHFKSINDTAGHTGGDLALTQLADILLRECRRNDICGRWGGEEFALLLETQTAEDILICAERLRYAVSVETFGSGDLPLGRMTVSLGIVKLLPGSELSFEDYYQLADEALYRAKTGGRDQVQIADQAAIMRKLSALEPGTHDWPQTA